MSRRLLGATLLAFALAFSLSVAVLAGNPHFVGDSVVTVSGNTVTVSAKEAGLGDEDQIRVRLTGDARCVNPGGNDPQAGNKQAFATAVDVPVQNGKASYSLTLTAVLRPNCTPPMTIRWSNVVLADTTNGLVVVVIP